MKTAGDRDRYLGNVSTMLFTPRRSLILFLIGFLFPLAALAQTGVFERMTADEQTAFICGVILGAEIDVIEKILDATRDKFLSEIVAECSKISPKQLIRASVSRTETYFGSNTLGTRLMERRNKWGFMQEHGYISITNPYPSSLESFVGKFSEANCGETDGILYEFSLETPIPPHETRIVQFDYHILTREKSDACLNIVDARPRKIGNSDDILERVFALVRAQQWHDAGLLIDIAEQSSMNLPPAGLAELLEIAQKSVRSLPAIRALENRNGYDFLLMLDPGNEDYAKRLERYQRASLPVRMEIFRLSSQTKLPVVPLRLVIAELSDDKTRAQRAVFWEKFEGKELKMSGRVIDVQPPGWFFNAQLDLDLGSGVIGSCFVKDFLNEAASSVRLGERIDCIGKLFNYTLLFGYLNLSVSEAVFER